MRRHKKNGLFGQVMPYAHQAQKKALKAQKKAQKKAGPVVEQAWDRVAPAVESAKDRLTPAAIEARDRAEAAFVSAMIASEPYRKEAMKRGTAAWLALRGDLQAPAPKKRHWVRNILLLGGIGGSAFLAYRILRNGTASEWMPKQSTAPETETETEAGEDARTEDTTPRSMVTTATTDTNAADMSGKHKDDGPKKEPAATASRANRKPGDLPKN